MKNDRIVIGEFQDLWATLNLIGYDIFSKIKELSKMDAQKAVLHPLFDQEQQVLKPRCVRALKRIFILFDQDRDGALSDTELNDFQVKCFNAPLLPSEIVDVKRVVQKNLQEGVDDRGVTLTGFLFIHALLIERGRFNTTWTVLRKFGYNNEIRLRDDQLPSPIKKHPDQSVELTSDAVEFLKNIFFTYDVDCDGSLLPAELEDMFSTAPENPWNGKTVLEGLSMDGFLSMWALMTLLDPIRSVETLICIGYGGDPSTAIRVTRRRYLDRKKQQSEKTVYQCFVFGPKESGKSALLNSFIRRPFLEEHVPTTSDRYVVNVVDRPAGLKKTLVLREIPEERVKELLSKEHALAACDVAIFVYDSSVEASWEKATEMLMDVASRGKATGDEVPCLIVAAKDDLKPYLTEIQDSTRVSQELGIEAPIPLSTKLGDLSNIFHRIVRAAEHPHLSIPETSAGKSRTQFHRVVNRSPLSIPETSAGKSRKQFHKVVNRSLMVVPAGCAVAVVGVAVCRVYAARRNSSS